MRSGLTVFVIALVATTTFASLFKSEDENRFGGLKAIQEVEIHIYNP